jgi:hypothetical protein
VYGIIATLNWFFFEFTTVRLTPLTVIEPFQWLGYLELHRIQSIIPTTVCFLSFNACSCLVHVTLYHSPSRRSPNFMALSRFKLSPTTQFPRFVFWTVSPMRLLNRSYLQFDHKQIPLCATLVYFKFSCNWRVYCNETFLSFWFLGWFQGFLWFL